MRSGPAFTCGARFSAITVTVVVSLGLNAESLALRLKTYVPATLKDAVVEAALGFPKVTVPGPLTLIQLEVNVEPWGRPSSVAVPLSVAEAGRVIVRSGPAFTCGATFSAITVTVAVSLALKAESLALRRKTYVPAAPNVTVVEGALAFANVTVPGPLTLFQVEVRVEP